MITSDLRTLDGVYNDAARLQRQFQQAFDISRNWHFERLLCLSIQTGVEHLGKLLGFRQQQIANMPDDKLDALIRAGAQQTASTWEANPDDVRQAFAAVVAEQYVPVLEHLDRHLHMPAPEPITLPALIEPLRQLVNDHERCAALAMVAPTTGGLKGFSVLSSDFANQLAQLACYLLDCSLYSLKASLEDDDPAEEILPQLTSVASQLAEQASAAAGLAPPLDPAIMANAIMLCLAELAEQIAAITDTLNCKVLPIISSVDGAAAW